MRQLLVRVSGAISITHIARHHRPFQRSQSLLAVFMSGLMDRPLDIIASEQVQEVEGLRCVHDDMNSQTVLVD